MIHQGKVEDRVGSMLLVTISRSWTVVPGLIISMSWGSLRFLVSHHSTCTTTRSLPYQTILGLTVPSEDAVKNSSSVLFPIQTVSYTGSR